MWQLFEIGSYIEHHRDELERNGEAAFFFSGCFALECHKLLGIDRRVAGIDDTNGNYGTGLAR